MENTKEWAEMAARLVAALQEDNDISEVWETPKESEWSGQFASGNYLAYNVAFKLKINKGLPRIPYSLLLHACRNSENASFGFGSLPERIEVIVHAYPDDEPEKALERGLDALADALSEEEFRVRVDIRPNTNP